MAIETGGICYSRVAPFGKKHPPIPHRNFPYFRSRAMLELHLTAIRCNSVTVIPRNGWWPLMVSAFLTDKLQCRVTIAFKHGVLLDGHPHVSRGWPLVFVRPSPLSPSVQICDTSRPPTPRNPSDYVPVDNEDCVILSQFLTKCGRSTPSYSKAVDAGLSPEGINRGETE
jgi:hypothetical protein